MLQVTAQPDSPNFEIAESPAGGLISGLNPNDCLSLAMMLARAGRSRGAQWPEVHPVDAWDAEVSSGLRRACGESVDHTVPLVDLRQSISVVRESVITVAKALQHMEKIVGDD